MSFLQAVYIAFDTIRVQKLKSFFTVLGVTIGVTFLIAVVSIVGGMGRYMKDDLIGKLIPVNAFTLRQRPNNQVGDVTEEERRSWRRRLLPRSRRALGGAGGGNGRDHPPARLHRDPRVAPL